VIDNIMRKISKGNGMLFASFVAVSLCFIIIASSVRTQRYNEMSRNGMYTGNETSFTVFEGDDDLWDMVIPDLSADWEDYGIFLPMEEEEFVIRGVYINGEVQTPPMIWGDYFTADTSLTSNPTAVIGADHQDKIQYEDEKAYFSYGDTKFEVIGVMGLERESRVNNMILIDFNSALGINGIAGQYYLDAKSKKDIILVGTDLERELSGKSDSVVIVPGYSSEGFLNDIIAGGAIMNLLYVMIVVCFSLCTVLVTKMWLEFRGKFFAALNLCGYNKGLMALEIFKKYYPVTLCAYLTSVIIALIIGACISDITIFLTDILLAFIMSAGLGLVILGTLYTVNFVLFPKKV